jgi:murein DD-endopeptidase MepM/ murein hydrolase activator NlpD
MESGVVSYVGTSDVLGKFVVIDHGYGLKTWYAHLSEISVKAGDNVTKAQSIGKTGNTGFTVENRIHISFTVGNVAVSPYPLWDEGVIFPNFN